MKKKYFVSMAKKFWDANTKECSSHVEILEILQWKLLELDILKINLLYMYKQYIYIFF